MSISLAHHVIGLAITLAAATGMVRAGDRDASGPAGGDDGPVVVKIGASENTDRAEHRRLSLALAMLQTAHDDAVSKRDVRNRAGLARMIDGLETRVARAASRVHQTSDREIHVTLPASCAARRFARKGKPADVAPSAATLVVRDVQSPSPLAFVFFP